MAARAAPEILRVGWFKGLGTGTVCAFRVGSALIDTGSPQQWRHVKAFIRSRGVERVLISHHHEDHAGNANRIISELPDVAVYAAPETIHYLSKGFEIQLYRRIFWGVPKAKCSPQVAPARVPTGEGDYLELIETPGHSTDHHVVRAPGRGWLFSSDLYITKRPELFRSDEDPVTEMESLRRILEIDFDDLYCSHRGHVPDGRQGLRDRLAYLEDVQSKAEALLQRGYPLKAVTHEILGREDPKALLLTHGLFRKSHLIEHFARHYNAKQAARKAP